MAEMAAYLMMGDAVGHPVNRLVRVRIGPLRDGSLKPGEWRALLEVNLGGVGVAGE